MSNFNELSRDNFQDFLNQDNPNITIDYYTSYEDTKKLFMRVPTEELPEDLRASAERLHHQASSKIGYGPLNHQHKYGGEALSSDNGAIFYELTHYSNSDKDISGILEKIKEDNIDTEVKEFFKNNQKNMDYLVSNATAAEYVENQTPEIDYSIGQQLMQSIGLSTNHNQDNSLTQEQKYTIRKKM